jgi:hypothetical protein
MMKANPSTYTLVTVTMTITQATPTPGLRIERFRDSLAQMLTGTTQQLVHATLYCHAPDAQPDMLPKISEGEDGRGQWLICALVSSDRDSGDTDHYEDEIRGGMLESIEKWRRRLQEEGALKEVDLKVGVWKGDIFMS